MSDSGFKFPLEDIGNLYADQLSWYGNSVEPSKEPIFSNKKLVIDMNDNYKRVLCDSFEMSAG